MEVTGDKVILRTIQEQDRGLLLNLINDPEITRITGGYSLPASYEHHMDRFRSMPESIGCLYSIIADRKNPQTGLGILILSDIDLSRKNAEIYIKLNTSVRRHGYGQDAVNTLVAYAFRELGLGCIYANILESNMASRKLFEACGFKLEQVHRHTIHGSKCRNVCVYGIRIANMEEIEDKTWK